MTWDQLGLWFVTSSLGAGLVKLLDLAATRYLQRHSRTEQKVSKVLEYLKEFGELANLYRFYGHVSHRVVRNEGGQFERDSNGKFLIESRVLEPEPRLEKALETLKEADLNGAIAQKIAAIRLMSGEASDIVSELDPSGGLNKELGVLYWKTVDLIESAIEHKSFEQLVNALNEADEVRLNLRIKIQKYLN